MSKWLERRFRAAEAAAARAVESLRVELAEALADNHEQKLRLNHEIHKAMQLFYNASDLCNVLKEKLERARNLYNDTCKEHLRVIDIEHKYATRLRHELYRQQLTNQAVANSNMLDAERLRLNLIKGLVTSLYSSLAEIVVSDRSDLSKQIAKGALQSIKQHGGLIASESAPANSIGAADQIKE